jgi:hypothetical protein
MSEKEQAFSLTASDLKAILGSVAESNRASLEAIITEIRKPSLKEQRELDKEEADFQAAQEERINNSANIKQMAANKKAAQAMCTHEHKDGASHCVYIQNGNYILCQKCQDVVRPETRPDLFARLLQSCSTAEIFG